MDLHAVRTVVAVADAGRFGDAADDLGITQQAVSKRIAGLERELGVRLFDRTPRGAAPTVDGRAFLPHARDLLRAADRAAASVLPGRRALRVDVLGHRIGPGVLVRGFHRAHPDVELDVLTLPGGAAAIEAVRAGTVDATFRAVFAQLPEGVVATRVLNERHQLLVGPGHPLAGAEAVTPAALRGFRIWIPGIAPGTEWGAYYAALAAAFDLSIDGLGPNLGSDVLLETLAESPTLATLTGEHVRLQWPPVFDLRRIPLVDPCPVYPHSLVRRADNAHPGLAALVRHLGEEPPLGADLWEPHNSRLEEGER
ncbi:LysR family transcriptional regulator [Pseudonocardia ailaonensis]|uniref:LysR family transcriptional regulator n=1 Tax=Pseudonocardia ailaonensis TaxID=367279 RepID=A0ABN2NRH0_9PSEU